MDSGLNGGTEKEEAERAKQRLLIRLIVLTNQTAKNSNQRAPSFPPSSFYLFLSLPDRRFLLPRSLLQIIVIPLARLTGEVGVSM